MEHMISTQFTEGIGAAFAGTCALAALALFLAFVCEAIWRQCQKLYNLHEIARAIAQAKRIPDLERENRVMAEMAASRWDDLHDAHVRYGRLHAAVHAVYTSARWHTFQLPTDEQAELWANLRDAAGFEPGTATRRGVGDAPPGYGSDDADMRRAA
jgi:hypothetical protein